MHPLALTSAGNDAGRAQSGQMARDLGLWQAEDFNQITDTDFAVGHEMDEAQPGFIGQGLKEGFRGDRFDGHTANIFDLTDMFNRNIIDLSHMRCNL